MAERTVLLYEMPQLTGPDFDLPAAGDDLVVRVFDRHDPKKVLVGHPSDWWWPEEEALICLFGGCRQEGTFSSEQNFNTCKREARWMAAVYGGSELVGCAFAQAARFEITIEYVMTHPRYRGRGIAHRAVLALLAHAREHCILAARLYCAPEPHLMKLYGETCGFTLRGRWVDGIWREEA